MAQGGLENRQGQHLLIHKDGERHADHHVHVGKACKMFALGAMAVHCPVDLETKIVTVRSWMPRCPGDAPPMALSCCVFLEI